MEKRLFLAVALSFALVTLWGAFTGQCSPPPPADEEPVTGPGEPGPGVPGPGVPGPGGEPGAQPAPGQPGPGQPGPGQPGPGQPVPAEAPVAAGDPDSPQKDYVPETIRTILPAEEDDELEFVFTSKGGSLEGARLRHAFEADKTTPLDLVVPPADDLLLGAIDDTLLEPQDGAPGDMERRDDAAGPLRVRHWTRDEKLELTSAERDVIYTYTTGTGAVWTKQWLLPSGRNRYDVRLRISYRPAADALATTPRVKLLAATGLLRPTSTGAAFQYPNMALLLLPDMKEPSQNLAGIAEPAAEVRPSEVMLLGVRSHYYLTTWYADASREMAPKVLSWWATGTARDRREAIEENIAAYFAENPMDPERPRPVLDDPLLTERIRSGVDGQHQAWMVLEVPPSAAGAPRAVELPFYLGPIDRRVLKQDEYAVVKRVVTYPPAFFAPDILAKALLWIYDLFRGLFGNAGIAVILMTMVVRTMMMPLSIKNQLSMRLYSRKIAKIKPKLDELKAKFASKPQKFREEQAKLYREHGVGFPAGCLMLFVQLPIFFALFSSLRTEYTLRNAAFLWISDLSGPDKLIDFGKTVLDIGILKVFSINILPLLMVVLSVWQQKSMPKPADEQQAQQMRMMKWMPIIFAVILYNYTAGLALYMVLSSALAIVESRIVRWKDKDGGAAGAAAAWPGAM